MGLDKHYIHTLQVVAGILAMFSITVRLVVNFKCNLALRLPKILIFGNLSAMERLKPPPSAYEAIGQTAGLSRLIFL